MHHYFAFPSHVIQFKESNLTWINLIIRINEYNVTLKLQIFFFILNYKFRYYLQICISFYPTNSSSITNNQSITGMLIRIFKTPIIIIIMQSNRILLTSNNIHIINRNFQNMVIIPSMKK